MSKNNQHQLANALNRFPYFTYFWKGFRVVALKVWGRKILVIDEFDNYHFLEPHQYHLSLSRLESLRPKIIVKAELNKDTLKYSYRTEETLEK